MLGGNNLIHGEEPSVVSIKVQTLIKLIKGKKSTQPDCVASTASSPEYEECRCIQLYFASPSEHLI